jgi:hypothetical protein
VCIWEVLRFEIFGFSGSLGILQNDIDEKSIGIDKRFDLFFMAV